MLLIMMILSVVPVSFADDIGLSDYGGVGQYAESDGLTDDRYLEIVGDPKLMTDDDLGKIQPEQMTKVLRSTKVDNLDNDLLRKAIETGKIDDEGYKYLKGDQITTNLDQIGNNLYRLDKDNLVKGLREAKMISEVTSISVVEGSEIVGGKLIGPEFGDPPTRQQADLNKYNSDKIKSITVDPTEPGVSGDPDKPPGFKIVRIDEDKLNAEAEPSAEKPIKTTQFSGDFKEAYPEFGEDGKFKGINVDGKLIDSSKFRVMIDPKTGKTSYILDTTEFGEVTVIPHQSKFEIKSDTNVLGAHVQFGNVNGLLYDATVFTDGKFSLSKNDGLTKFSGINAELDVGNDHFSGDFDARYANRKFLDVKLYDKAEAKTSYGTMKNTGGNSILFSSDYGQTSNLRELIKKKNALTTDSVVFVGGQELDSQIAAEIKKLGDDNFVFSDGQNMVGSGNYKFTSPLGTGLSKTITGKNNYGFVTTNSITRDGKTVKDFVIGSYGGKDGDIATISSKYIIQDDTGRKSYDFSFSASKLGDDVTIGIAKNTLTTLGKLYDSNGDIKTGVSFFPPDIQISPVTATSMNKLFIDSTAFYAASVGGVDMQDASILAESISKISADKVKEIAHSGHLSTTDVVKDYKKIGSDLDSKFAEIKTDLKNQESKTEAEIKVKKEQAKLDRDAKIKEKYPELYGLVKELNVAKTPEEKNRIQEEINKYSNQHKGFNSFLESTGAELDSELINLEHERVSTLTKLNEDGRLKMTAFIKNTNADINSFARDNRILAETLATQGDFEKSIDVLKDLEGLGLSKEYTSEVVKQRTEYESRLNTQKWGKISDGFSDRINQFVRDSALKKDADSRDIVKEIEGSDLSKVQKETLINKINLDTYNINTFYRTGLNSDFDNLPKSAKEEISRMQNINTMDLEMQLINKRNQLMETERLLKQADDKTNILDDMFDYSDDAKNVELYQTIRDKQKSDLAALELMHASEINKKKYFENSYKQSSDPLYFTNLAASQILDAKQEAIASQDYWFTEDKSGQMRFQAQEFLSTTEQQYASSNFDEKRNFVESLKTEINILKSGSGDKDKLNIYEDMYKLYDYKFRSDQASLVNDPELRSDLITQLRTEYETVSNDQKIDVGLQNLRSIQYNIRSTEENKKEYNDITQQIMQKNTLYGGMNKAYMDLILANSDSMTPKQLTESLSLLKNVEADLKNSQKIAGDYKQSSESAMDFYNYIPGIKSFSSDDEKLTIASLQDNIRGEQYGNFFKDFDSFSDKLSSDLDAQLRYRLESLPKDNSKLNAETKEYNQILSDFKFDASLVKEQEALRLKNDAIANQRSYFTPYTALADKKYSSGSIGYVGKGWDYLGATAGFLVDGGLDPLRDVAYDITGYNLAGKSYNRAAQEQYELNVLKSKTREDTLNLFKSFSEQDQQNIINYYGKGNSADIPKLTDVQKNDMRNLFNDAEFFKNTDGGLWGITSNPLDQKTALENAAYMARDKAKFAAEELKKDYLDKYRLDEDGSIGWLKIASSPLDSFFQAGRTAGELYTGDVKLKLDEINTRIVGANKMNDFLKQSPDLTKMTYQQRFDFYNIAHDSVEAQEVIDTIAINSNKNRVAEIEVKLSQETDITKKLTLLNEKRNLQIYTADLQRESTSRELVRTAKDNLLTGDIDGFDRNMAFAAKIGGGKYVAANDAIQGQLDSYRSTQEATNTIQGIATQVAYSAAFGYAGSKAGVASTAIGESLNVGKLAGLGKYLPSVVPRTLITVGEKLNPVAVGAATTSVKTLTLADHAMGILNTAKQGVIGIFGGERFGSEIYDEWREGAFGGLAGVGVEQAIGVLKGIGLDTYIKSTTDYFEITKPGATTVGKSYTSQVEQGGPSELLGVFTNSLIGGSNNLYSNYQANLISRSGNEFRTNKFKQMINSDNFRFRDGTQTYKASLDNLEQSLKLTSEDGKIINIDNIVDLSRFELGIVEGNDFVRNDPINLVQKAAQIQLIAKSDTDKAAIAEIDEGLQTFVPGISKSDYLLESKKELLKKQSVLNLATADAIQVNGEVSPDAKTTLSGLNNELLLAKKIYIGAELANAQSESDRLRAEAMQHEYNGDSSEALESQKKLQESIVNEQFYRTQASGVTASIHKQTKSEVESQLEVSKKTVENLQARVELTTNQNERNKLQDQIREEVSKISILDKNKQNIDATLRDANNNELITHDDYLQSIQQAFIDKQNGVGVEMAILKSYIEERSGVIVGDVVEIPSLASIATKKELISLTKKFKDLTLESKDVAVNLRALDAQMKNLDGRFLGSDLNLALTKRDILSEELKQISDGSPKQNVLSEIEYLTLQINELENKKLENQAELVDLNVKSLQSQKEYLETYKILKQESDQYVGEADEDILTINRQLFLNALSNRVIEDNFLKQAAAAVKTGDAQSGVEAIQGALSLNPENEHSLKELSYLLKSQGKDIEAHEALRKSKEVMQTKLLDDGLSTKLEPEVRKAAQDTLRQISEGVFTTSTDITEAIRKSIPGINSEDLVFLSGVMIVDKTSESRTDSQLSENDIVKSEQDILDLVESLDSLSLENRNMVLQKVKDQFVIKQPVVTLDNELEEVAKITSQLDIPVVDLIPGVPIVDTSATDATEQLPLRVFSVDTTREPRIIKLDDQNVPVAALYRNGVLYAYHVLDAKGNPTLQIGVDVSNSFLALTPEVIALAKKITQEQGKDMSIVLETEAAVKNNEAELIAIHDQKRYLTETEKERVRELQDDTLKKIEAMADEQGKTIANFKGLLESGAKQIAYDHELSHSLIKDEALSDALARKANGISFAEDEAALASIPAEFKDAIYGVSPEWEALKKAADDQAKDPDGVILFNKVGNMLQNDPRISADSLLKNLGSVDISIRKVDFKSADDSQAKADSGAAVESSVSSAVLPAKMREMIIDGENVRVMDNQLFIGDKEYIIDGKNIRLFFDDVRRISIPSDMTAEIARENRRQVELQLDSDPQNQELIRTLEDAVELEKHFDAIETKLAEIDGMKKALVVSIDKKIDDLNEQIKQERSRLLSPDEASQLMLGKYGGQQKSWAEWMPLLNEIFPEQIKDDDSGYSQIQQLSVDQAIAGYRACSLTFSEKIINLQFEIQTQQKIKQDILKTSTKTIVEVERDLELLNKKTELILNQKVIFEGEGVTSVLLTHENIELVVNKYGPIASGQKSTAVKASAKPFVNLEELANQRQASLRLQEEMTSDLGIRLFSDYVFKRNKNAYHNVLLNLKNGRVSDEPVATLYHQAGKTFKVIFEDGGGNVQIATIDLQDFKNQINGRYGHDLGDKYLQQTANGLDELISEWDGKTDPTEFLDKKLNSPKFKDDVITAVEKEQEHFAPVVIGKDFTQLTIDKAADRESLDKGVLGSHDVKITKQSDGNVRVDYGSLGTVVVYGKTGDILAQSGNIDVDMLKFKMAATQDGGQELVVEVRRMLDPDEYNFYAGISDKAVIKNLVDAQKLNAQSTKAGKIAQLREIGKMTIDDFVSADKERIAEAKIQKGTVVLPYYSTLDNLCCDIDVNPQILVNEFDFFGEKINPVNIDDLLAQRRQLLVNDDLEGVLEINNELFTATLLNHDFGGYLDGNNLFKLMANKLLDSKGTIKFAQAFIVGGDEIGYVTSGNDLVRFARVDINNFGATNQRYGSNEADKLKTKILEIVQSNLEINSHLSSSELSKKMNFDLLEYIASTGLDFDSDKLPGLSIGVAEVNENFDDIDAAQLNFLANEASEKVKIESKSKANEVMNALKAKVKMPAISDYIGTMESVIRDGGFHSDAALEFKRLESIRPDPFTESQADFIFEYDALTRVSRIVYGNKRFDQLGDSELSVLTSVLEVTTSGIGLCS